MTIGSKGLTVVNPSKVSQPPLIGMFKSSSTMSMLCWRNFCRASCPLAARTTSNPSASITPPSASSTDRSSSTRRTLGMFVVGTPLPCGSERSRRANLLPINYAAPACETCGSEPLCRSARSRCWSRRVACLPWHSSLSPARPSSGWTRQPAVFQKPCELVPCEVHRSL
jgi:hypothetical protein